MIQLMNNLKVAIVAVSLCSASVYASETPPGIIYTAKTVISMDEAGSTAQAVAVSGDRIVAIGSLGDLKQRPDTAHYRLDNRFKDKVIMPGFIDNHIHPSMAAILLPMDFITPFDWNLSDRKVTGVQGREAFLEKLIEIESKKKTPDEWLFTWGYHQYFHGEMSRKALDKLSLTRPIIVWHRSFHEIYANTAALKAMGMNKEKVAGHPHINMDNGHFYETALPVVFAALAPQLMSPEWFRGGLEKVRDTVHKGGVTTIADMAAGLFGMAQEWPHLKAILDDKKTPFRSLMIPSSVSYGGVPGDAQSMTAIAKLSALNSEKLQFVKQIKLLADGAFFSQLMQLKAPGYLDGHHGEWLMEPKLLEDAAKAYWNAGYQLHIHSNGDKGTEVVLNIIEKLITETPKADHRTTLHHLGYSSEEQSQRMASLGVLVSANPYYLYSMGDKYSEIGLGPERASEIVRSGSLVKAGVPLSFHSDFTMAPVEPLTLAWVAVNRFSASGKVMAPDQKISVDQALRAVTINAAYAIQMENEVGSIEVGKKADFTILEENPYEVSAKHLKDIVIFGTVFEGVSYPLVDAKGMAL